MGCGVCWLGTLLLCCQLLFVSSDVPTLAASKIKDFVDHDTRLSFVSGSVTIVDTQTSGATGYRLFTANLTDALTAIANLSAQALSAQGVGVITLPATELDGATYFRVYAFSDEGLSEGFLSTPIVDCAPITLVQATASLNVLASSNGIDNSSATTWTTASNQATNTTYGVMLKGSCSIVAVTVTCVADEYPRNFKLEVSDDGVAYFETGATLTWDSATSTSVNTFFLRRARDALHVRLRLTGDATSPFSIAEITVAGSLASCKYPVPSNIAFVDTDSSTAQIGGSVSFSRAVDETDVIGYSVFLATGPKAAQRNSRPLGTVLVGALGTGTSATIVIADNTAIGGASMIQAVALATGSNYSPLNAWLELVDVSVPYGLALPTRAAFTDTDPSSLQIGGTVSFLRAENETLSNVVGYKLYLATTRVWTSRYQLLGLFNISDSASNTTATFVVPQDTAISLVRTYLHVVSFNEVGDSEQSSSVFVKDLIDANIAVYGNSTEISGGDVSPTSSDHTLFPDTDILFETNNRTFTIQESTADAKALLVVDRVAISGTAASSFRLETLPSSQIVGGGSSEFVINFDPVDEGLKYANVTVWSNAANVPEFIFTIAGYAFSKPDITVFSPGHDLEVQDEDMTPSYVDGTNFGSVYYVSSSLAREFVVTNVGSGMLSIYDVVISGEHASDFTITTELQNPNIYQQTSGSFEITFDPSLEGVREANVTIFSNDADGLESNFTFTVGGEGTYFTDHGYGVYDDELRVLQELVEGQLFNNWVYQLPENTSLSPAMRPGYWRDEHFVWLEGVVSGGAESHVFTLPETFRPHQNYTFVCDSGDQNTTSTLVTVFIDGKVHAVGVPAQVRLCGHFPFLNPTNEVTNGDFATNSDWSFSASTATLTLGPSATGRDGGGATVAVTVAGAANSVVLLSSEFETRLYERYVLRAWIKSDSAATNVSLGLIFSSNGSDVSRKSVLVDTTWTEYELVMPNVHAGHMVKIAFELGASTATVDIDDVFVGQHGGEALYHQFVLASTASVLGETTAAGYLDPQTNFLHLRGAVQLLSDCSSAECTIASGVDIPDAFTGFVLFAQQGDTSSATHVRILSDGSVTAFGASSTNLYLNGLIVVPVSSPVCAYEEPCSGEISMVLVSPWSVVEQSYNVDVSTPRVFHADQRTCISGGVLCTEPSLCATTNATIALVNSTFRPMYDSSFVVPCLASRGSALRCVVQIDQSGLVQLVSVPESLSISTELIVVLDGICYGGFVFLVEVKLYEFASIEMSGGAYIEFG